MRKILFLLQIFFKFTLIFLLSFVWLRFFIKTLWLCVVLSCAISIFANFILFLILKKNKSYQSLKISEKEKAEDMFFSLSLDENYLDFFKNLVNSRHKNIEVKDKFITVLHQNGSKVILFPHNQMEIISSCDLLQIINKTKKENGDKLVILCYDYDKSVISFSKNFDFEIVILNRFESYLKLYKEYDYYPEITIKYKKEAKTTFKELLAYSFNKSRTKGYVFASIILLLTSFFVKLNLYYCIISSILLLFALISYFNPKYNYTKKENII